MKNIVIINIKTATILAALIFASATVAQAASAEDDATLGRALAYTCLGCHGIDGYRNAYPSYRVPKLGGQKSAYLIAALQGYRDGTRQHPTMAAQATSLTDEQIKAVAVYLASLSGDTVAAARPAGAGLEAAAVCVACHGQNGISLSPSWPTLAGQHQDYLEHALNQYRNGTRQNSVMAPIVASLSDDDVELLARYYSRLDGLETSAVD